MHSALTRVQAVFNYFTTVAVVIASLASLSVLLHPANDATTSVELANVQVIKGRPHYYSSKREEYAQIRFDLDADLTPLFNWNTKQLFVYVVASYPSSTAANETSQAVIWDTIIPAPESPYSFPKLKERFFPDTNTKRSSRNKKGKTGKEVSAKLRLRNQKPKYPITDISGRLAERENVTLVVGWNVQPWVGALWWSDDGLQSGPVPKSRSIPRTAGKVGRSRVFNFPALKGSSRTSTGTSTSAETAN